MPRTSETDPLIIDNLPCGPGVIGLTFCPGKQGPSVFGKPWARDLQTDLAQIKAWGANAVVTLMESHELNMLRVVGLGEAIESAQLDWHHLPVVDLGAPDARFERLWVYHGHLLRMRLRRGERVLLHCRGGRGRTGTIAAKLLVEAGVTPAEAVRLVRATHSQRIETQEQLDYVLSLPVAPVDDDRLDRVLGTLIGGAVGDAFGYAVEFDRLDTITARFGPAGLVEPVFKDGKLVVSDDTQMTLFTAAACAGAARSTETVTTDFVEALRARYQDWLRTQTSSWSTKETGMASFKALWASRAPGMTCMSALRAGEPDMWSKGCGGVMRVAPISLCFEADVSYHLGCEAALITHGNPTGWLSAGALCVLIAELAGGTRLQDAIDRSSKAVTRSEGHGETLAAIGSAVSLASESVSPREAILRLGEGWVGEEALAIAIYAVLVSKDFKEVIRIAANHDGDSDSTASIAGQIWGAMAGLDGIPHVWTSRLDVLEAICAAADGLMSDEFRSPPAKRIDAERTVDVQAAGGNHVPSPKSGVRRPRASLDTLPSWWEDARRAARRVRAQTHRARGVRHNLYVILLDSCGSKDGGWGLYVGESSRPPHVRFEEHMGGIRSGRGVQERAVKLLPKLFQHLNPCKRSEAKLLEKQLAAALSEAGVPYVQGGGRSRRRPQKVVTAT